MAHDDYTAFNTLCSSDLRHTPQARVWRIFSNQYFLPLLMLNPYHGRQMDAFAEKLESGGQSLWTPGLQALWTPNARLAARIALGGQGRLERVIHRNACASTLPISEMAAGDYVRPLHALARVSYFNTTKLFVATMYASNGRALKEALATDGISVHWLGRAMKRRASRAKHVQPSPIVLMGGAHEVLVTPGSTFGYVAQGLAVAVQSPTAARTHHAARRSSAGSMLERPDEPNFHFLKHALRLDACKAGLRNARARGSEIYQRSSMQH